MWRSDEAIPIPTSLDNGEKSTQYEGAYTLIIGYTFNLSCKNVLVTFKALLIKAKFVFVVFCAPTPVLILLKSEVSNVILIGFLDTVNSYRPWVL